MQVASSNHSITDTSPHMHNVVPESQVCSGHPDYDENELAYIDNDSSDDEERIKIKKEPLDYDDRVVPVGKSPFVNNSAILSLHEDSLLMKLILYQMQIMREGQWLILQPLQRMGLIPVDNIISKVVVHSPQMIVAMERM